MIVLDAQPAAGLRFLGPPQERLLNTRAIAASILAARGRAGRPPFMRLPAWRRGLLAGVLAASVTAAGCVIQQRAQGVLPMQPLPPPPSEPGVKAANPAAQASPPAPERKPLSVPR